MSNTVVSAENLAKVYRLGPTISGDLRETLTDQIKRLGRRRTYTGKRDGSNEHWALRDVGFEVVEGEVFGIIGRNGAGKSTLLKILSRVSPPTRGHARMVGRVGALLEVGTGFHPELNGRENTYLNGAILGMTRREIDRVYDSIVEYAGIQEFMEMPVKRYSSGMRVRLGFAIAAHLRPEILILDEVLAVGDVEFQRKSSRTILDYTRGGHTVLFVSHNMEAVRTICSRTLVLDKGQVTFVGPTDQAIEYYQESLRPADGTNLLKVRRDNPSLTPLIANVRFSDGQGTPTVSMPAGGSVSLGIELANPIQLDSPYVEIVLLDAYETRIALVSSRIQTQGFGALPPAGRVHVQFDELPLLPGNYFFNIEIGNGNSRLDFLARAAELHVTWADVFGTGRLQENRRGPLALKGRFGIGS